MYRIILFTSFIIRIIFSDCVGVENITILLIFTTLIHSRPFSSCPYSHRSLSHIRSLVFLSLRLPYSVHRVTLSTHCENKDLNDSPTGAFFGQDVRELSPSAALQCGIRNIHVDKVGNLRHVTKRILHDYHVVASPCWAGTYQAFRLYIFTTCPVKNAPAPFSTYHTCSSGTLVTRSTAVLLLPWWQCGRRGDRPHPWSVWWAGWCGRASPLAEGPRWHVELMGPYQMWAHLTSQPADRQISGINRSIDLYIHSTFPNRMWRKVVIKLKT